MERRRQREMTRDGWRLISVDRDEAEEKLARLGPVVADQLGAALNDQISMLRVITGNDMDDNSINWVADTSPPPWAATALTVWTDGGRLLCPHLTWTMGPQPLWLLAWAPERVRCTSCMTFNQVETNGTLEDFTCDQCREPKVLLTQAAVTMGNMSILGGICDGCIGTTRG